MQNTLFGEKVKYEGYSPKRKKIIEEHMKKVDEHNKRIENQEGLIKAKPTLCECGKEVVWDTTSRDKCEECLKNFFISEFRGVGLGIQGFKKHINNYIFYSHTTGKEIVRCDRVISVFNDGFNSIDVFPYCIQTCDEYGLFSNCLGVTREFGDFLIKEHKMIKVEEDDGEDGKYFWGWKNPSIKQDEKGQKKAELEKEIKEKSEELKEVLKKKHKQEVTIKVLKKGVADFQNG